MALHPIADPVELIQNVRLYTSTLITVHRNINVYRIRRAEGSMLTASEITAQIERDEIVWPGELRGDGLLLQLGSPLQLLTDPGHVIDLASQDSIDTLYIQAHHGWDEYELAPGQMVLCAAKHPLRLGPAFAAGIASLSHLARVGLATHVTSPWVMPGWDGHLTLELLNSSPARLRLRRDMPVARALIWHMCGATHPPIPHGHYGRPEQLGSRYAAEFGTQLTAHSTRA
jgi:deoxycytidine triphosphate deaminase